MTIPWIIPVALAIAMVLLVITLAFSILNVRALERGSEAE